MYEIHQRLQYCTFLSLDPLVEPTIIEISANQTIVEGERVTFTCKATGNPLPQITWKTFLESGADNAAHLERPSPQSIRISSTSPTDAGQYVCIAENDSGNDTEAVYLRVLGENNTEFACLYERRDGTFTGTGRLPGRAFIDWHSY